MSVRLIRQDFHRGIHADLSTSMHPEHPCREVERSFDPVRANDLRPRWTTRLAGPRGSTRTRRQDASTPFLQPTFTSRALDIDTTSGDCQRAPRTNPPRPSRRAEDTSRHPQPNASRQTDPWGGEVLPPFRPGPGAGPPRGHPASSGCVLDGTPAGFGPIDGRLDADAPRVRAPALFRLTGRPVDRHPLAPYPGVWS
jgi:hypothetical protein